MLFAISAGTGKLLPFRFDAPESILRMESFVSNIDPSVVFHVIHEGTRIYVAKDIETAQAYHDGSSPKLVAKEVPVQKPMHPLLKRILSTLADEGGGLDIVDLYYIMRILRSHETVVRFLRDTLDEPDAKATELRGLGHQIKLEHLHGFMAITGAIESYCHITLDEVGNKLWEVKVHVTAEGVSIEPSGIDGGYVKADRAKKFTESLNTVFFEVTHLTKKFLEYGAMASELEEKSS